MFEYGTTSQNIKESKSLASFKNARSYHYNPIKVPKYYYNVGCRRAEVLYARLRMRCSTLKQHLFLRNIEPDPYCSNCNSNQVESIDHYFLKCSKYRDPRSDLFNSLNTDVQVPITSQLLLYGNELESYEYNCHIFRCVQNFILKTKRFI